MSRPSSFMKVPKNRVGVLIGPNAATKELIERKLGVQLEIDSEISRSYRRDHTSRSRDQDAGSFVS